MFMGAVYYVATHLPTLMPMFLTLIGLKARLLPYLSAVGLRDSMDLEGMGRQLENGEILESGFDLLNVKNTDCRRRAACEMGEWLSRSHPTVARALDVFR